MPEQGEAEGAPQDIGPESLGEDLGHHRQQPEQAGGVERTERAGGDEDDLVGGRCEEAAGRGDLGADEKAGQACRRVRPNA